MIVRSRTFGSSARLLPGMNQASAFDPERTLALALVPLDRPPNPASAHAFAAASLVNGEATVPSPPDASEGIVRLAGNRAGSAVPDDARQARHGVRAITAVGRPTPPVLSKVAPTMPTVQLYQSKCRTSYSAPNTAQPATSNPTTATGNNRTFVIGLPSSFREATPLLR